MSKKSLQLTRRRALGALATIGVGSAAAGAGTFAAFSDTEQTSDNQVSAGTLDLTVDGDDDDVKILDVSDAAPGDSGSGSLTLENEGSIDGLLQISIDSVTGAENDVNDAEADSEDEDGSVESPGSTSELLDVLELTIIVGGTTEFDDTLSDLSTGDLYTATQPSLDSGSTTSFELNWEVPESAGNEIQSDSASVDATFTLTQA